VTFGQESQAGSLCYEVPGESYFPDKLLQDINENGHQLNKSKETSRSESDAPSIKTQEGFDSSSNNTGRNGSTHCAQPSVGLEFQVIEGRNSFDPKDFTGRRAHCAPAAAVRQPLSSFGFPCLMTIAC
jgi:hypothetical protein